jgi:hypothetical protein
MYSYNLATSVYKELAVTYGEVAQALTQLGFQDESDNDYFKFVNKAFASEILLPARPLDTLFVKANTVGFSNLLFMQGIIKEPDKLVKLIEKNRAPAKSKKQQPVLA